VGDEGATAFAEVLKANQTIQKIYLSGISFAASPFLFLLTWCWQREQHL
jgi:hypothetical protein